MAYKLLILSTAESELDSIVAYLNSKSTLAAGNFLDELEKQLELITSGIVEHALSRMPELAELGYRTVLIEDYLFLYFVDKNSVVVAHFFHQRQDYAAIVAAEG